MSSLSLFPKKSIRRFKRKFLNEKHFFMNQQPFGEHVFDRKTYDTHLRQVLFVILFRNLAYHFSFKHRKNNFSFCINGLFFFFLKKLQEDQDVRNLFVKIVLHGGTLENYNKTTIVRDLFLLIFHLLFIVTPPLTFFNKRVGSVKFAIPFYLDPFARYTLGVKRVFQLAALRFKKNKNYGECLGEEFIEIIKGRSQLLKKKQEEERLFKFNRAFLYYLKGK